MREPFFVDRSALVWGAALFLLLPDLRDRHAADAPVVRVHFIDGHHRGGLVLAQYIMEQIRRPSMSRRFCSGVTWPSFVILILTYGMGISFLKKHVFFYCSGRYFRREEGTGADLQRMEKMLF